MTKTHAELEIELLSDPEAAWRPRAMWGLRCREIIERNDPAEIAAYVAEQGPSTPPLYRVAEDDERFPIPMGKKPDHRLKLFGSIPLRKKGQAKRLLGEPDAAGLVALTLLSPSTLDVLLDAREWPFTLRSMKLDFAPKPAQFEAMATHPGFASLEFFGLYNTLKDRFEQLAALPWLPKLRSLALHYVLDRARDYHTEALAKVAFERLAGFVATSKNWAVTDKVMRPLVDAPWMATLEHIELELPSKSTKLSDHLATRLPLEKLKSWRLHGAWSEETLVAAFARLESCERLQVRPVSWDQPVGMAPAQALLRSGCVPSLYDSLEGFSEEACNFLADATGRDETSIRRGKPLTTGS